MSDWFVAILIVVLIVGGSLTFGTLLFLLLVIDKVMVRSVLTKIKAIFSGQRDGHERRRTWQSH